MHSPRMLTIYTNRQTRRGGRMVPYNSLWACSLGQGRNRKESLQLCLCNLNICIKKVDAKCWLVEMTVTTSLPFACVFQCLFTLILRSFPLRLELAEIWQLSWRGATGELEVEFKFQRCVCKLSFLFLPLRACSQATPTRGKQTEKSTNIVSPPPTHIFWSFPNGMLWSTWFSIWNVWLCHENGKYPWQLENLVTPMGFGP